MTPFRIQRVEAADWESYREIRIRALREAPEAFGSTAADAERLTEREWRQRLAGRITFLAVDGATTVGLVSGIASDLPGEAELISMWVDPAWRARGIGSRLVDSILDWAASSGFRSVRLWVAEGNLRAERLYAGHGFVRTGDLQRMGRGEPARTEFAMGSGVGLAEWFSDVPYGGGRDKARR